MMEVNSYAKRVTTKSVCEGGTRGTSLHLGEADLRILGFKPGDSVRVKTYKDKIVIEPSD